MNRILFYVVLVSLLVSAPIAIKFAVDAKRIQRDLTTQVEAASVVRTELAEVSDSLKSKTVQVTNLTISLDSVSQLYRDAATNVNRLASKSSRLGKTIDSLRQLSSTQLADLEARGRSLSTFQVQLTDTSNALSDVRSRLAAQSALLKEREFVLTQLEPWYEKWKHDATERNWLEKIFGADKAKTPEFPEPSFPVNSTVPVDSVTQDSSAAMQASK